MQIAAPSIPLPLPTAVERPRPQPPVPEVKESSSGNIENGSGGADGYDALNRARLVAARLAESAPEIGPNAPQSRAEPVIDTGLAEVTLPGNALSSIDTREVGDGDVIDPNRPTVRGPEPLTPEAQSALSPASDPLSPELAGVSDPTDLNVFSETVPEPEPAPDEADAPDAATPAARGEGAPDARPAPAERDVAEPILPQAATLAPGKPSPQAAAPDVPEPPSPGQVDLKR